MRKIMFTDEAREDGPVKVRPSIEILRVGAVEQRDDDDTIVDLKIDGHTVLSLREDGRIVAWVGNVGSLAQEKVVLGYRLTGMGSGLPGSPHLVRCEEEEV